MLEYRVSWIDYHNRVQETAIFTDRAEAAADAREAEARHFRVTMEMREVSEWVPVVLPALFS